MNPPMFEEAASIFNRCPLQMLNSLSPLLDLTSSAISPTTSSSQPVLSDPICTLKSSKSILSWDLSHHSLHLPVELQVAFVIPNGVHNEMHSCHYFLALSCIQLIFVFDELIELILARIKLNFFHDVTQI